ncbi:MAG: hypothetical protein ACP5M0_01025 [Desulfomonilaceae bacterium]
MKLTLVLWASIAVMIAAECSLGRGAAGMTPEQIFQASIDWQDVIGTWEAIPEEHPLSEDVPRVLRRQSGTLLTLRRDGTCRMFDQDHPTGADGIWTFENHEMFVKLGAEKQQDFYIYGIKGDFMVTRSPVKGGKDQLWSRVR